MERVKVEYEIAWLKEKALDFHAEIKRIIKELNVQFYSRGLNKFMECLQFVYYLLITEQWIVKAISNKCSGSGNKLQQRDEYGDPMHIAQRDISKPLLCHSEFWKQRGGERAYSILQENFFNEISKRYGAKRRESTSRLKYAARAQAEF